MYVHVCVYHEKQYLRFESKFINIIIGLHLKR